MYALMNMCAFSDFLFICKCILQGAARWLWSRRSELKREAWWLINQNVFGCNCDEKLDLLCGCVLLKIHKRECRNKSAWKHVFVCFFFNDNSISTRIQVKFSVVLRLRGLGIYPILNHPSAFSALISHSTFVTINKNAGALF